jgi:hypothetical protein
MSVLILAAALIAAPPANDPAWETYACDGGPEIRLALIGGRPADSGFLAAATGAVALTRQKDEPAEVLRGGGYMVRPFNWTEVLYAPPGREKAAYQCRIADAKAKPPAPTPE